jgi:hypothetical protein
MLSFVVAWFSTEDIMNVFGELIRLVSLKDCHSFLVGFMAIRLLDTWSLRFLVTRLLDTWSLRFLVSRLLVSRLLVSRLLVTWLLVNRLLVTWLLIVRPLRVRFIWNVAKTPEPTISMWIQGIGKVLLTPT